MPPDPLPPYEQELRAFLAPLGVDLDAQAVVFQLYRTSTDVIAALEAKALRPLGLSHTGFALLITIWVGGPQEVRGLARKHRLSKPSITSAIGTLERLGLVARERSDDDRRLVSVALTARGRRLVRRAQADLHRCERALTAGLTNAERRQMAAWLRRVGDAARNGA
jgi:DNA-binding MarR family transcriptional regulator